MYGYRLIIINCRYQHLQFILAVVSYCLHIVSTLLLFAISITQLLYFRARGQFKAEIQLDILKKTDIFVSVLVVSISIILLTIIMLTLWYEA